MELHGIVLGTVDFGESHRIVHMLTVEEGRLSLLARGGRASRKRFAGALDRYIGLRMQARAGRGLWTLAAADVVNARLGLRQELARLTRASLLCECVRKLVPERQRAPEFLALFGDALDGLDRGEIIAAAGAYPRLLAAAGISPDLSHCHRCGGVDPPAVVVNPTSGEVDCADCAGAQGAVAAVVLAGARLPADLAEADAVEANTLAVVTAHCGAEPLPKHGP
ncbi:MAG: DNA repair protein RecO [Deltaproteobacteria bacterium]|nr:DNA repair protein RecO [Deltaproteobacteria bacterium]